MLFVKRNQAAQCLMITRQRGVEENVKPKQGMGCDQREVRPIYRPPIIYISCVIYHLEMKIEALAIYLMWTLYKVAASAATRKPPV
jgi:hypothetical protein